MASSHSRNERRLAAKRAQHAIRVRAAFPPRVAAGREVCAICGFFEPSLIRCTEVYALCDECMVAFEVGRDFRGHHAWDECDAACEEAEKAGGVCRHGVEEDYTCLREVAEVMAEAPTLPDERMRSSLLRRLRQDVYGAGGVCQCLDCRAARGVPQ